jgi:hypothetical protein
VPACRSAPTASEPRRIGQENRGVQTERFAYGRHVVGAAGCDRLALHTGSGWYCSSCHCMVESSAFRVVGKRWASIASGVSSIIMISYLSYSVGISGGGLGQEMDKEIVKLKEQHAKQNPVMQVAAATSALGLGPAASALGLGPATHWDWALPPTVWPTLRILILNRTSALRAHTRLLLEGPSAGPHGTHGRGVAAPVGTQEIGRRWVDSADRTGESASMVCCRSGLVKRLGLWRQRGTRSAKEKPRLKRSWPTSTRIARSVLVLPIGASVASPTGLTSTARLTTVTVALTLTCARHLSHFAGPLADTAPPPHYY